MGIFLQGSTMTLSGTGVNSGVTVLDQLSSSGSETGVAGVYKTNYNPNTAVQTMTANDSVTNNANLYVSSITSGTIIPGMIFKIGSQYFNIDSVISSGVYGISSTGQIPSIYPQTITTSLSFSNSIVVNVRIPDGYYTAEALNYYLQNIMIANNCYLTDSTGTGINTYYFEIMQLWVPDQRVPFAEGSSKQSCLSFWSFLDFTKRFKQLHTGVKFRCGVAKIFWIFE